MELQHFLRKKLSEESSKQGKEWRKNSFLRRIKRQLLWKNLGASALIQMSFSSLVHKKAGSIDVPHFTPFQGVTVRPSVPPVRQNKEDIVLPTSKESDTCFKTSQTIAPFDHVHFREEPVILGVPRASPSLEGYQGSTSLAENLASKTWQWCGEMLGQPLDKKGEAASFLKNGLLLGKQSDEVLRGGPVTARKEPRKSHPGPEVACCCHADCLSGGGACLIVPGAPGVPRQTLSRGRRDPVGDTLH